MLRSTQWLPRPTRMVPWCWSLTRATRDMPVDMGHHGLAPHEVVLLQETDPKRGLAEPEAARRLERLGPNVLPATVGGGWLVRVLRQVHHPLIYVLIAAGVITAVLGEYVDSAVIFGVVLVNAVVGFV